MLCFCLFIHTTLKVVPVSAKLCRGCENILSTGNAQALAHFPPHTHAEMHLNQPIRSSRGFLITKTGPLPCPNDWVLAFKQTHTPCLRLKKHAAPLKHKWTHAQLRLTPWPPTHYRSWSKRMMLGLSVYQRRMVGKKKFGQRVIRCSSASAQTSSSRQRPPLFTSS